MSNEHSSVRGRVIAAAFIMLCGGVGSFTYGVLSDSSLLVHSLLFCFAMAGASYLLWLVHNHLVGPLMALRRYAQDVAEHGGGACPMGAMPKEYAELRDSICAMVESLGRALEVAHANEDEAERNAAATERALSESRAAEAHVRDLLSAMGQASSKASEAARRIFSAVGELSQNMERVDRDVVVQRERVQSTTEAIGQMDDAIQDIARNTVDAQASAEMSRGSARDGANGVRGAVASIDRVKGRILDLKGTMTELGQQAEGIGRVLGVISDIADQTNLLALNAAIEAARAGDAGRGFAVVADEVRKLAEKTMTATREVGESLRAIQNRARENVAAVDAAAADIVESARVAEGSGQAMESIVTTVEQTARMVASIAGASKEQTAASEEITRSVAEVNRVAQANAENVNGSIRVVVEISGLAEELDSVIQGMAQGNLTAVAAENQLMAWTDELSVGIQVIDDQHKVLLGLINELHAAMRQRKSDAVLTGVVARLKEYTVKHFGQEEQFFERHGYPETKAHKELHAKLVEQVLAFEADLKSGRAKVTMEIMRFLKDWLVNHIMGADKRYGPYLNAKGVR